MTSVGTVLDSIELNQLGCDHADIRVEETYETLISALDGEIISNDKRPSLGAFLRVYQNGWWLYESTTKLDSISEIFQSLIDQANSLPSKEMNDLFKHVKPEHFENIRYEMTRMDQVSPAEKTEFVKSLFLNFENVENLKEFRISYKDFYQKRGFKSSKGVSFLYDISKVGYGRKARS